MSDAILGASLALLGALVGSLATIQIARASRKETLRLAAVDVAAECQEWWEKNCLYLDPKSRGAFREGTIDAALNHDLKGENAPRETFSRLRGVLDSLVKGAGLPTIGENEWAKGLWREKLR